MNTLTKFSSAQLLQKISTWIILVFLAVSLLYPVGNKFDMAQKIYLVLAFGWLAGILFLFALVRFLKNRTTTQNTRLDVLMSGAVFAYALWTLLAFFRSQTANFGFTEVVMLFSATTIFLATKLSNYSLLNHPQARKTTSHGDTDQPIFFKSVSEKVGLQGGRAPQREREVSGFAGTELKSNFLTAAYRDIREDQKQTHGVSAEKSGLAGSEASIKVSNAARRPFQTRSNLFDYKLLFKGTLALLIINALAGFGLYLFTHHTRAFGLFFNPAIKTDAWPNAYATFILFLWPLYFYDFWKAKSFLWLRGILFSFILSSFLLTFSRAGFLAFGGQIILLGIFGLIQILKKQKIPWKKLLQISAVIILSLGLTFSAQYARKHIFQKQVVTFEAKAQFSGGEEITSVQERIDFMKGALKLALQQPLFGYGPMSFNNVYRHLQTDWLAISDHPHNLFLKIAAETGLPALLFFSAFLLLLAIKIVKNYPHLKNSQKLTVFILTLAVLGGLAHHLVDYNLNFATNFIIFWLLLMSLDHFTTISTSTPISTSISTPTSATTNPKNSTTIPACGNNITLPATRFIIPALGFTLFLFTLGLTAYESYNTINYWLARKSGNPLAYQSFEPSLFPKYFFLQQADRALEQKNYQEAKTWYNRHLQTNPWDSATYNRLGELQEKTGHLEEALTNYRHALSLDPKNSWAYYQNTLRLLITLQQSNKADPAEIKSLAQTITTEMQQYLPKVKQNLHFTAQHQESLDAIAVLRLLLANDPQNANAEQWQEYLQKIEESRKKYNS